MNVQEYIESGVLHDYCMNVLSDRERAKVEKMCIRHACVQEELLHMQKSLENFTRNTTRWPSAEIKESIWHALENINKEKIGDLFDLPVISKYSDHRHWKRIVKPFLPEELKHDRVINTIREYGGIKQMLIISRTDVEEETHENERESFIILEGECECYIGNKVIHLSQGGFIEIPMFTQHNVKVLTPHVMAVLQHVAV